MMIKLRPPGTRGSSSSRLSARVCVPGMIDTQLLSVVGAAALLPASPPAGQHRLAAGKILQRHHIALQTRALLLKCLLCVAEQLLLLLWTVCLMVASIADSAVGCLTV